MHIPVLIEEAMALLDIKIGGNYLDCTFGAGGYTNRMLEINDCSVLAIDMDQHVEKYASILKARYLERFKFIKSNFSDVDLIQDTFDGIVFDLGISSMQVDTAERGFSFMRDGPLDMRMDKDSRLTAQEVVNSYSEFSLQSLIFMYGEERNAKKIAKAICDARIKSKIETTFELADIITSIMPERGKIHQATKTFQAIRMEVNSELRSLKTALEKSIKLLKVGGSLVLVTFHSIEDAIVKNFFKSVSLTRTKRNKYATNLIEEQERFKILTTKPILPSRHEVLNNPRARSAKIRALRRCI